VILTPHAIAWTDQLARDNGLGACRNVLAVLRGEVPEHTVNRDAASRPGLQAKLRALRERWKEHA
jgi:phosphoglycerate dehydrogenase-like enzyme